jgi:hypothetical protein
VSQSAGKEGSLPLPTSEIRQHPHKPTLLKREAARNLAHVVKIGGHHDTAACIFSNCCRNVSTVAVNSHAYHCRKPPQRIALVRSILEIRNED